MAALAQERDVVRRQVLLTQVARADAGRWDEAYPLFDRAVQARARVLDGRAAAYSLHVARWTRARAARALGRHDEALAELRELARTEIGAADDYVAEEIEANESDLRSMGG